MPPFAMAQSREKQSPLTSRSPKRRNNHPRAYHDRVVFLYIKKREQIVCSLFFGAINRS